MDRMLNFKSINALSCSVVKLTMVSLLERVELGAHHAVALLHILGMLSRSCIALPQHLDL